MEGLDLFASTHSSKNRQGHDRDSDGFDTAGGVLQVIDNNGFFRSYPNEHNMDGFFAALFMKRNGRK